MNRRSMLGGVIGSCVAMLFPWSKTKEETPKSETEPIIIVDVEKGVSVREDAVPWMLASGWVIEDVKGYDNTTIPPTGYYLMTRDVSKTT